MGQGEIVLCDTDIIIEFYRNNAAIISKLRSIGQQNIAISVITVGELLFGALNKKELIQIKKDIKSIEVIDIDINICNVFREIMEKYSLSHKLTLPDAFIAASAIANNIQLLTLNIKDYRFINGLKIF